MTEFKSEKTLLFVHGASQPAEGTFDLPLEGLSWMDYVDRRGWDVYLVDVRGYGASTRPPEMINRLQTIRRSPRRMWP